MILLLRCILLASAPALFWMWLYYRRDRWEKEPKLLVFKLFVFGGLAAVPVYFIEGALRGPESELYDAFVRVALVEELAKLIVIWLFAYRRREFNEPMDGIVYSVAAALGFATVENVFYALALGDEVIIYRSFTSTLAHLGFSGLLGYHLGLAKFRPGRRTMLVLRGLLVATLLHGVYDYQITGWTVAVMVPLVLILLWWAMREADAASPFRKPQSERT
ncbi:MAG: PrsW family intramembrane metalloprotease [Planctomycetota bacterium]|jgi:RsiW-degrading membrane proteinase PrsW (M82 family)